MYEVVIPNALREECLGCLMLSTCDESRMEKTLVVVQEHEGH